MQQKERLRKQNEALSQALYDEQICSIKLNTEYMKLLCSKRFQTVQPKGQEQQN